MALLRWDYFDGVYVLCKSIVNGEVNYVQQKTFFWCNELLILEMMYNWVSLILQCIFSHRKGDAVLWCLNLCNWAWFSVCLNWKLKIHVYQSECAHVFSIMNFPHPLYVFMRQCLAQECLYLLLTSLTVRSCSKILTRLSEDMFWCPSSYYNQQSICI
jgi:hypothetical protein